MNIQEATKEELDIASRVDQHMLGFDIPFAVFKRVKNPSRARDVVKQKLVKVEGTNETQAVPDVSVKGRHYQYWRVEFVDPSGAAYTHIDAGYVEGLIASYEYVTHGGDFRRGGRDNPHLLAAKYLLDQKAQAMKDRAELERLRKLEADTRTSKNVNSSK